jgi:hypothetical protein
MQYSAAACLFLALSVSALPTLPTIEQRQTQGSVYPYGIDPTKPFTLTAISADGATGYNFKSYFTAKNPDTVALGAISDEKPGSNFTIVANHYGTQLSVYQKPSGGASAVAFGNYAPVENTLLTFHEGINTPNFGGLAFYGQYLGGDFEAGIKDILSVGGAQTLTPYKVCNKPAGQGAGKALFYGGTDASCVSVIVYAYPVQ